VADEARLEKVGNGLAPVTDGWFVVNAREAPWLENDAFGFRCRFETDGRIAGLREGTEPQMFGEIGYTLAVVQPGKPSGLYHAEGQQEDFFVVSGECLAIVEEEERRLGQFDFLHCPAGTNHILVGLDAPCVVLMIGNRTGERSIRYPVSEVAQARGAGVDQQTDSPPDAYARFPHWRGATAKPTI
jgi:uncharacterized cupin superfamily protein